MDNDNNIPWIFAKPKNYTNGYGNNGNNKYSQNSDGNYNHKKSTKRNNYQNNNNNYHHNNSNNNNNNQNHQLPKHIEFNLSSITIDEYHESVDYNIDDYKLRFRYKYLEGGLSIFLNDNRCKIYIHVDNIEAISKVQPNAIVLTLKRGSGNSINYNSKEGYIRDDPIRENLYKTSSINMIAQESTPQQVIDMVGLHIHYLINRNNKNKTKFLGSNWGRSNSIPCLLMKEEEILLKCHVGQDIRILSFTQLTRYEEVIQRIQESFEIAEISKLKYKDEEGEFITIINNIDFDTAVKLYKKENKLEIWIIE